MRWHQATSGELTLDICPMYDRVEASGLGSRGATMIPLKYFFMRLPDNAAQLERIAQELNVSLFNTQVEKFGKSGMDTYEVQRRIREALSHARDSSLWAIALLSAIASVFSAIAAWLAVASK